MWKIYMEYCWLVKAGSDVFDEHRGRELVERFYHYHNLLRFLKGIPGKNIRITFFEYHEDQK